MKPDYKNWMPKGMVLGMLAAAVVCLALTIMFGCTGLLPAGGLKTVLTVAAGLAAAVCTVATVWMTALYRAFSYRGRRQLSRQIIEGLAAYVSIPDGGVGLDVGCGSGALTIACAKRNPQGRFLGVDRWGKEYASFSKTLCEENARAEGVDNTQFRQGNAVKLDFPDESFDAVVSNYVYHNIPSSDRQAILMETLRVVKPGGIFALHDIFSKAKYGDMAQFTQKLRTLGYAHVELINTADGTFMTSREATWMGLAGSALLVGRK